MSFNFLISPQKDEIINTTIHIDNTKPALIGNVLNNDDKPIKDAFLILYEIDKDTHKPKNASNFAYTDEWGNFAIAPLEEGKLYSVKIYTNNNKIRFLEQN